MDNDWLHTVPALGSCSSSGDGVKGHRVFGMCQFRANVFFTFKFGDFEQAYYTPFLPSQVLLKKNHYNDIATLFTNQTAVELTLSTNGNYLIQVKAMSEGGEGVGSEPIHIHKPSEFNLVFL